MATKTLSASFPSRLAAEAAARGLRVLGVGAADIQLRDAHLRARVDDAYCGMALESLRDGGAQHLVTTQNDADSQDWINHHNGRVTSAGVPPGQGDSEAGSG